MRYVFFGICISIITVGFFALTANAPYADMRIPVVVEDPFQGGTVLFVGDMMLGRYVEKSMNENGEDFPFEKVAPFFENFDLVVGNLEGPILSEHVQTPINSVNFSFDKVVAPLLFKHGVDVVSLANNHTHDKLEAGYVETQTYLDDAGVAYFGHPLAIAGQYVHVQTVGDVDLFFVGANVTYHSTFDLDEAVDVVALLEVAYPDSIIVFVPHWGEEYQLQHSKWQEDIAHSVIDAGADLVIGHHPHVVQDIEQYQDVMIFYSLGNFIFDQIDPETKKGLAVALTIEEDDFAYTLYPIQIVGTQPYVLEGQEREKRLLELKERSGI